MKTRKADAWFRLSHGRRVLRLTALLAAFMFVSACWQAASANAATITVNTPLETATFNNTASGGGPNQQAPPRGPMPSYNSFIDGDSPVAGKCSLREAINSANNAADHLNRPIGSCETGTGNDTIVLDPGTYGVYDNFFIGTKMTFQGPNAGVPGNAPKCSAKRHRRRPRTASCRGAEATLSFDYNPNYAAQVSMFWLDSRGSGEPSSNGAGTLFDGLDMRGGFTPDCSTGLACEIVGIVQPTQGTVEKGYTLTNSIMRDFSFAVYLGGTDTITRNLFEGNDRNVNVAPAAGWDIYSDFVYTSADSMIADNVFNNPDLGGVILQGDTSRGTVYGGQVEHNLFLKELNHDLGVYLIQTSGATVKNNLFESRNVGPLPGRLDSAIRMDRVDKVTITGNTITGWGNAIKIGGFGSGPPGVSATVAFNRIYDNLYGVQVTAQYATPGDYMPLAVNANDNWWGANGGPGSTGARPGAINPVNGVQFFDIDGNPVANQGGLTVDRWLHLTCTVPSSVQVNVPAPVVGQVVGMPTVNVTSSTPPWFYDHADPLMAASAPGVGNVYGFDQVPDQGPNNAQLTGTLLATNTGSGDVLVDLDSERVACPLTAAPGPSAGIGKDADTPTVTAGGLAGYRITVTNRGRVTARNWWVCDRIPRRMTFVRATRKLRRFDGMRCLVVARLRPHQRASFHVTLRDASNDPNTTETNTAEVIPGAPAAPAAQPPPLPVPIKKVAAKVKISRPAKVRTPAPRPPRPTFTG